MPTGQCLRIEPRENRGSRKSHECWILYQQTDWQKSEGFRERERRRADLAYRTGKQRALAVRWARTANSPEARQTCQNVRQGDGGGMGEIVRRDSPLRGGWWCAET